MTGVRQKPIETLLSALSVTRPARERLPIGDYVVHWFRGDLRLTDNTALSLASRAARTAGEGVGLVGLYVLSPQDLEAHVVSPAKLDFALRSLRVLKGDLEREFGVPLWIEVVKRRKDVTKRVLELCRRWGAGRLFANMEYEVDELRRDAKIVKDGVGYGVSVEVVHDLCVVPPGDLSKRPFTAYTPWFEAWVENIHSRPSRLELFPPPERNPDSFREAHASLFDSPIPSAPPRKALEGKEQAEYLASLYPAGEHAAQARQKVPEGPGGRLPDMLSVHFASGTLSARQAVRPAEDANSIKAFDRESKGIQTWISAVARRDFYKHVLVNWPFIWYAPLHPQPTSTTPLTESHFRAFCTGHTGFPIVDAAIRQLLKTNQPCTLNIDWRRGERFFMEHLIDGDFASNNAGWGWCAGAGVGPQRYFLVLNPTKQSLQFDPSGEYIRTWVEELRGVKEEEGRAVHAPFQILGEEGVKQIGYVAPLVEHEVSRARFLEAYKGGSGGKKRLIDSSYAPF
ncbi:DNA photolyase, FAD-binding/Cryptochrome [Tuber borchii]|uniref:DNA photolyase, FAD-binding/Cryptochrome n=1 Tax=Tuber borchii TaxID=42251 RepID=A0A2T6ZLB1_TUBBO|nr:DNA photolyase, FAD-binding/Cryptochrome [Tuber borchii]